MIEEKQEKKKQKNDVIIASASFIGLILLILSTILFPLASMGLGRYLSPMYNLGAGGGYTIAAAIVLGLTISCTIALIILILMLVFRKKPDMQQNLLKIYFLVTFLIQIYLVYGSYFSLVREQFNLIKSINSVLFLFVSIWYIYFPAIIMLLVYLIIKSVSNIRNNNK